MIYHFLKFKQQSPKYIEYWSIGIKIIKIDYNLY